MEGFYLIQKASSEEKTFEQSEVEWLIGHLPNVMRVVSEDVAFPDARVTLEMLRGLAR